MYSISSEKYAPYSIGVALIFVVVLMSKSPVYGYDWLQFNANPQHSGNNTSETIINIGNVKNLHMIFKVALPAVADGAPVYLSNVSTPSGTKDLIFVTTKPGHVLALNAKTGAKVWARQNPPGSCRINFGSTPCYTTSSPAIDFNRKYIYAYGLDGRVHKYRVGDGFEISGSGGWPEVASLKPFDEKGSSNLSIAKAANGAVYLYVANGGYPGDLGDYQGHITAINLANGSQTVFNSLCSDQTVHFVEQPGNPDCADVQSAVWARSGVVYDSNTNRIFMGTGNGTFDPVAFLWGDTVLALSPDGSGLNGKPLDSYTPTDYQLLQNADADLGSTAPAILPTPLNSAVRHLAVQGGKDGLLRLLNLDDLSGSDGPGHIGGEIHSLNVPQGGEILTAPAVWVNPKDKSAWVFVANGNGISGMKLSVGKNGIPNLGLVWKKSNGGASPIVANGILYYAGSGNISAVNPTTGAVLWKSTAIGGIHWESPIVANGKLYITDESGNLTAYAPGS